jgi:hypothetical protein
MTTFDLKLGETRNVTFEMFEPDGTTPTDLTGLTVSMVIEGRDRGLRLTKTATLDSPASLGTGAFAFVAADYATLRASRRGERRLAEPFDFTVWVHDASNNRPRIVGTFDVYDVPQRT